MGVHGVCTAFHIGLHYAVHSVYSLTFNTSVKMLCISHVIFELSGINIVYADYIYMNISNIIVYKVIFNVYNVIFI